MNHVSSILKRPGVKDDNEDGGEEEGEEESAYNEHFKKNAGKLKQKTLFENHKMKIIGGSVISLIVIIIIIILAV